LKELEALAPPLPKSITFKDTLARALKSCALKVKLNPDLSRRSTIIEMYSLKLSEFITLNFPSLFSEHAPFMKKLPKDFTEVVLNCNNTKDRYEFRRGIPKDVSSIYSTRKYRRRLFLFRGISLSFGKEIEGTISMDSHKLCKALGLDFVNLKSFIDALVKSGLHLKVKSYSEKFVKVRKPKNISSSLPH
jgi:predicted AAA+ superfamily ATPase